MPGWPGFLLLLLLLAGCGVGTPPAGAGESIRIAALTAENGFGPDPVLPEPDRALIPTVNIAPPVGWAPELAPTAPEGFTVTRFAADLTNPRWLYVLPNGDVLVAETNAPERPDEYAGIKGWVMKRVKKRAGASVPSPDRITLFRDADGDGQAEERSVLLKDLNAPFGMTLGEGGLYVANTDALMRFPYREGDTEIRAAGTRVAPLPAGELNHHWTKNVVASADGRRFYVSVGSNSNVAENGLEREEGRAAILEIDGSTGTSRLYASGLRNPVGMDWQPGTGVLWTVVNERDEIGDNLVPDYLARVVEGAFYGWPYSYWGQHRDERVEAPDPASIRRARVPDYGLGNHTASLGLVFYDGQLFPDRYVGGAFVGQHGSWNREEPSGYQVIFVRFAGGRPTGLPEVFLTGFLDDAGNARGRPVGVALDRAGALLVADDVGKMVWRVAPVQADAAPAAPVAPDTVPATGTRR